MKKYSIFGFDGFPLMSGTIASFTASTGFNYFTTPWLPTHFGFDEVAEIITWHAICDSISGSGNLSLNWQGTWNSGFTTTADTKIDGLLNAINGNSTGWIDGVVNIATSEGTKGFLGRSINGAAAGSANAPGGPGPLSPYVRALVNFAAYSGGGIFILYAGLYGERN